MGAGNTILKKIKIKMKILKNFVVDTKRTSVAELINECCSTKTKTDPNLTFNLKKRKEKRKTRGGKLD